MKYLKALCLAALLGFSREAAAAPANDDGDATYNSLLQCMHYYDVISRDPNPPFFSAGVSREPENMDKELNRLRVVKPEVRHKMQADVARRMDDAAGTDDPAERAAIFRKEYGRQCKALNKQIAGRPFGFYPIH